MKNAFLIFVMALSCTFVSAQSSKGFSFQGYARGADGSAMQNETNLPVIFTIYSIDEGNPEFTEEQSLKTDEFGVFQAVIGTVNSSDFNDLNFAAYDYMLKVQLKDGGIWQEVTKTSLLAVPYAKAAEKATAAENVTTGGNGVPVGSIMPFAGASGNIPEGWLWCNGTVVSKSEYPALYEVIGEMWGDGDNSTDFNLPDLRGAFLRGVDHGRGLDDDTADRASYNGGNSGDNVGSLQGEGLRAHSHAASTSRAGNHSHKLKYPNETDENQGFPQKGFKSVWASDRANSSGNAAVEEDGEHSHTVTVDNTGGKETRPDNYTVNYIIKY